MKSHVNLCLALLTGASLISSAYSGTLNWIGGPGNWDTSTPNWSGGLWSTGNTAVFGGAAGNVSVVGTIPGVDGLTFNTTGYALTGTGTLTLTAPTISLGSGITVTDSGALFGGTTGLTITGGGTFVMTKTGHPLTGTYQIDSGSKLVVGGNIFSAAGNDAIVNGTVDFAGSLSTRWINHLTGNGLITADSLAAAGTVNLRVNSGDFAGTIQDGPDGRKIAFVFQPTNNQCGTFRLSGNNTYSEQTLVRNGATLRLDSPGSLSPNSWLRFETAYTNTVELAAFSVAGTNFRSAGGINFAGTGGSPSPRFVAIGADRSVTCTNALDDMIWGLNFFNIANLMFGSPNSTHKMTWTGPFSLGSPSTATTRMIEVYDGPPAVDAEISGAIHGDFLARLHKAGGGTLVLSGANDYFGPTLISGGTLVMGAAGISSGSVESHANTVFDVAALPFGWNLWSGQTLQASGLVIGNITASGGSTNTPGGAGVPATMTVNGNLTLDGATSVLDLSNVTTVGGGVNDLVQVNGSLTLNGLTTIHLNALSGALANGSYKLIKYTGTLSGGVGNLVLTGFGEGSRQIATLKDNVAGEISLEVAGAPASLVWSGADPTNPTWWDVGTSVNWLRGATPDAYLQYDHVTFNTATSVDLQTALSPSSITVNTAGTVSFLGSGNLTGSAPIVKNGTGTLILGNYGVNDNTGPLSINAGTVIVGNNDGSGSIGSGAVTNNGTLKFQNFYPISLPGALSGNGALVHEGQEHVYLNGDSSFTGTMLVNPGARLTLDTVAITPPSTATSLGNPSSVRVLADGALNIRVPNNSTFNAPLLLNGDGWSSEATGALRTYGIINWSAPITLQSAASIGVDLGPLTLEGPINGGSFNFAKTGAGTMVLATNNTYGDTIIEAGVLQIGTGSTNGTLGQGTAPIVNNGTLVINRSDNLAINNTIMGSGGVTKLSTNVLLLSAANSFLGEMRLSAGTLLLGQDSSIGTGPIRYHLGDITIASADTSTRTIVNSNDFASGPVNFGTPGSGNLVFTGPMNTGSGAKTFRVNNAFTTFSGVIAGGTNSNANTKEGPGTLVFSGANTYGKPTVVQEGTLLVDGSIGTNSVTVNGGVLGGIGAITGPVTIGALGTVSPGGSPGTLTINESLTLAGNVEVDINKAPASSDLITGLTSVNYGGKLTIKNVPAGLTTADSFKLFNASTYSGAFTSIVPSPGAGLAWDPSTLTTDGTLRIAEGGVNYSTNITAVLIDDTTLQLSWPETHRGWYMQSNSVDIANSAAWFNVEGSQTETNLNITINPSIPRVFYRLKSEP